MYLDQHADSLDDISSLILVKSTMVHFQTHSSFFRMFWREKRAQHSSPLAGLAARDSTDVTADPWCTTPGPSSVSTVGSTVIPEFHEP